MRTSDENPHLIDTKMYLFHVERHIRGVVTTLVIRLGSTNNKPPMCLEAEVCMPYNWMTQKRPVATVKEKLEEDVGQLLGVVLWTFCGRRGTMLVSDTW